MYNHKFLQNTNVRLQTQSVCVRLAWCPLLPHLCRTMFSGGRRGVPTQGLLVSLLSLDASVLPHSGSLRLLLSLVIDMLFVALWSPLRTGLRSGDLYRGVTKAGRVPLAPDVDSSSQATGFFFIELFRIGLLITQMETTEIRILL